MACRVCRTGFQLGKCIDTSVVEFPNNLNFISIAGFPLDIVSQIVDRFEWPERIQVMPYCFYYLFWKTKFSEPLGSH